MKKLKLQFSALLFIGLAFTACQDAPESDDAVVSEAQEEQDVSASAASYTINKTASNVEWIGTKTGGRHNGTVMVKDGEFAVENGEIVGGNFTLDMTTILSTDAKMDDKSNQKLTGHLRSPDFFEVDKFPDANFVITEVKKLDGANVAQDTANTAEIDKYKVTNPTHEVTGNLTIKGVTKSVTFPAKIEMNDNSLNAIAKFNINRKDWDIKYELMGEAILSNTIHLGIGVQADKAQDAI